MFLIVLYDMSSVGILENLGGGGSAGAATYCDAPASTFEML